MAAPAATISPAPRRRVDAVTMTLGAMAAVLLAIAATLITIHLTQRDGDGFFTSRSIDVAGPGYAITSERLDLASGSGTRLAREAVRLAGTARVEATSATGRPIFVGVARQADAERYLGDVERTEVLGTMGRVGDVVTRHGRSVPEPPARQRFWTASSSGAGTRAVTWKLRQGRWAVVVMNADGSRGLHTEAQIGFKTELIAWSGYGFLVAGLFVAGLAVGTRPLRADAP